MSEPSALTGALVGVCAAGISWAVVRLLVDAARCLRRAHPAAPAPRTAAIPSGAAVAPPRASVVDDVAVQEGALAARITAGEVDALDYAICPAERRTTPHALRADGSRRCWQCHHTTAGN
ncbi:hypothetical protein ACFY7V_03850 [[Kitasatospora] papulosa]|uniref:hypothetical protein n=1 Tax=Streptomyces TaxID=1883 RepID=UPI002FF04F3D